MSNEPTPTRHIFEEQGGLYTVLAELDGSGDYLYLGQVGPGNVSNTSSDIWRIRKFEYTTVSGKRQVTKITWPDGSRNFDKAWDSRAGYSYS